MAKIYLKSKLLLIALFFSISASVVAQTITLGSGTATGGNTTAGPINQFYRSLHCQMVYTAAELTAAGISGGTMTQFGFYINTGVTNPLPNYTIKMKNTSAASVATYDGVGLTQVHNIASYNPPAGGFDLLTLNTPFVWNGVDNILVDVCFDQVSAYTSTGTVRLYASAVTNGFIFVRADGSPQCGVNCNTTSTNKPQAQMTFLPPPPFDLGINTFVKPSAAKQCFGNDTIVVRLKNYGSADADFSVNPTVITVNTTGPVVSTQTLALNTGTLAASSSQDFTMTTSFNMATAGTYKFKGYTTATGDGVALNDTTNLTVTRAAFFTTSTLPNDSVCLGVPVQLNAVTSSVKQVGSGTITNSSTTYPAPYGNFYEGARHQFLFLASELAAAGLSAGNVTSISFNATNLNGSDPLSNYNVAIATTTLTSITAFQTTGFTSYFSTPSYTPVLGTNTHLLSTPFVWDGVSNIIIETCFENTLTGYTNNVSITQSATSFISSVWHNADADPSICSGTTVSSSMSQRPNIGFGQPTTVTYSWSPSTELTASNISNPVANLTTSRTYTVTADKGGCVTSDVVSIHVKPTPTPNLGNDTTFCTLPAILNANTTSNAYLWSNGATTSTLNISSPGTYWVRATNTNGCKNSDTIVTVLGSLPIVTLGPDTSFCQGSSVNLYAGNPGSTYAWSNGSTSSVITVTAVGSYSVIVTNSTSCQSSDMINITTRPNPTVSLVFTGQTVFCPTESGRTLGEGQPAGGTYIGAGVTGNVFNANQAGQGSYVIFYNYTGSNGCSATAKDTLKVNACVGVEELNGNLGLSVYPNPTTGIFTLEVNANTELSAKIYITSVDGRIVYTDLIEGNGLIAKSVNINELANGVYYLRLESEDAIKTYKLLKQ